MLRWWQLFINCKTLHSILKKFPNYIPFQNSFHAILCRLCFALFRRSAVLCNSICFIRIGNWCLVDFSDIVNIENELRKSFNVTSQLFRLNHLDFSFHFYPTTHLVENQRKCVSQNYAILLRSQIGMRHRNAA